MTLLASSAFHAFHQQPRVEYAHIQPGNKDTADDLVDAAFDYLAVTWPQVTALENPGL
ncbi:hypothetical protein [Streptomyces sp. NPDC005209]|uniref:hypothetical protein n=1 Tax=Streptomyces sp. NPDC005209 TaxID=3156715 RepID=UPI0033AC89A6